MASRDLSGRQRACRRRARQSGVHARGGCFENRLGLHERIIVIKQILIVSLPAVFAEFRLELDVLFFMLEIVPFIDA